MAIDYRLPRLERNIRRRLAYGVGRLGLLLLLLLLPACNFDPRDAVPSVAAAERERTAEPQELDARHLTARGIPDDFLFAPDFVWLNINRTDVPWQASRTEDPDNIRGF